MAVIHETLTMDDQFSAAFTRYINMGNKAAGTTQLAQSAAQNYQSVLTSLDRRLIDLNGEFAAGLRRQEAMVAAGMESTQQFAELDNRMEQLGETIRDLEAQYQAVSDDADRAARSSRSAAEAFSQTDRQADRLTGTLTRLAGTYLSLRGMGRLIGLSDTLSQTTARLDRMNDGLQTTQELQNMIAQSAMRSRGVYADTADFVAKLGTLASEAFTSNGELVAFAEQINKQMVLSGASTTGAQAAMLQLTQALSSGVLRGEELNSVLEQTPMIAQTIANYMGVTTGQMRELASQGLITADIVKNAMLSASAETDAAFAQMPLTWGQLWTQAQNIMLQAFQPALEFISSVPQMIVDNYQVVIALFVGLTAAMAFLGAQATISGIQTAGAFLIAHWPLIAIIGAVSAFAYGMMQTGATAEDVFGVIGEGFGFLYAFVGNIVVDLYNLWASFAEFFANVFDDPLRAAGNLFFDFVDTILGLIQTAAGAIDTVFGTNLEGTVSGWRSGLDALVDKAVGANQIQIARMERIEYAGAMEQFGDIGRSLGSSLEDFAASFASDAAYQSAMDYSGLEYQLGNIANDTGALRKEVALEQEDLKSLVDLAERRYVNNINLTAQTPVINVSGQNTGSTQADRQALANAIRDILLEQAAAGSTVTTARAF